MAFQAADVDSDTTFSQFFAPHEVNSFMLKKTNGDDLASEIDVSLRYYFKSQAHPQGKAEIFGFNPFFSYTGKYDFYWWPVRDTRPSAPVISRFQNPAVHFRYQVRHNAYFPDGGWGDIGLEHISNGQALTARDNQALIQNASQSSNNAIMDSISRVGALIALTLEGSRKFGSRNDLTVKWYVYRYGQEADVFWGRFANRSVNFNDFQRIKVQWRTKYDGFGFTELPWQFSAEMSIGKLGFAEDSWNFMLNTPVKITDYEFPFAFTAHRGPMNNLSDYTRPQNTFAFGLTFAY